MKLGFQISLIKGIVLGIRHFDPEEYAPYYEIQFFILVFRLTIYIFDSEEN
jgi:hypothetical protein